MTEPHAHDFDSMNTLVRNLPDDTEPLRSTTPSIQITSRPSPHQHNGSLSQNRSRRSLASLARERTSSALASLASIGGNTSPSLRTATSSGSLSQLNTSGAARRSEYQRSSTDPELPSASRRASGVPLAALDNRRQSRMANGNVRDPNGRMHSTTSKVLRMTPDDRPYAQELKDLFATLITSLPLTPHRVRFTRIDDTFTSEEAIQNLGTLRFAQSNRVPNPDMPGRMMVATTTTTFSMGRDMARAICQRFVDARMIESAESKTQTTFVARGAVWQLTAKGLAILSRFCARNGIKSDNVEHLVRRQQMKIVALEREEETDRVITERSTIELIFRRFIGQEGPNLKSTISLSDSDSVSEYASGVVGVKMLKERRVADKIIPHTFTGKATADWLMDCCTIIERRETYELAELFVKHQLMAPVIEDRPYTRAHPSSTHFQPTKYAVYTITEKGQRVCGWGGRPPSISSEDSKDVGDRKKPLPKDSNQARLQAILGDAALRLSFKEFLRDSLCEENLLFYLEVRNFIDRYRRADKADRLDRPEAVRDQLAAAYGLYNSFLASGAPSELNIDHGLRNRLDSRMIRTESDPDAQRQGLDEVVELFEVAEHSVFKLMASDSVPKFIRHPDYVDVLREHDFDTSNAERAFSPGPERALSRSNTAKRAQI